MIKKNVFKDVTNDDVIRRLTCNTRVPGKKSI
jgi:hypothetical protein